MSFTTFPLFIVAVLKNSVVGHSGKIYYINDTEVFFQNSIFQVCLYVKIKWKE